MRLDRLYWCLVIGNESRITERYIQIYMTINELINSLDEHKTELLHMSVGRMNYAAMSESSIARAWAAIVDTAFAMRQGRTDFDGFEATCAVAIQNVAAAWSNDQPGEPAHVAAESEITVPVKKTPLKKGVR